MINEPSRLSRYRLAPTARLSALDLIRDQEAELVKLTDELEQALWRRIGSRLPESVKAEVESAVRGALPELRELVAESARVQSLPLERLRVQVQREQELAVERLGRDLEVQVTDRLPEIVRERLPNEPVVVEILSAGLNEQESRLQALRQQVRDEGRRTREDALQSVQGVVRDELPGVVAEALPLLLLQQPGTTRQGAPGALEPVPAFYPFGETEFAWLKRQIENIDVGFGELTGGNTWSGNQVFQNNVDIDGNLDVDGSTTMDGELAVVGGINVGTLTGRDALVDINRAAVINNPTQAQFISLKVQPPADTGVTNVVDPMDVYFALNRTVTFAAGHPGGTDLAAVNIQPPTYAAAAAVTFASASTVRINTAPIAGANVTLTRRNALHVIGTARFDQGAQAHVFEFNADNTDPTGGGGAATGRIPILIAGALRFIPYYT